MKMKLIPFVTLALMSVYCADTWAQTSTTSLYGGQLVLMARGAVADEVTSFNDALAHGNELDGYRSRMIDYFQNSGKASIDPNYVSDKCIFSENNLASLFSSELSSGDDALYARKNALSAVKAMYGPRIWRLVSEICVHARGRFLERLQSATQNGELLSLDEGTIEGTASLVFFPTDRKGFV